MAVTTEETLIDEASDLGLTLKVESLMPRSSLTRFEFGMPPRLGIQSTYACYGAGAARAFLAGYWNAKNEDGTLPDHAM